MDLPPAATRAVQRARSRAGAADRGSNDCAIESRGLGDWRGVETAEVAVPDDVGGEVSPGGEVGTGLDLQTLAVAAEACVADVSGADGQAAEDGAGLGQPADAQAVPHAGGPDFAGVIRVGEDSHRMEEGVVGRKEEGR